MPELESREPLYAQIEKLLLDRIRKQYRAGDLIPTQKALAEETGASLITVKRALAELARHGFIQSVRGRGTVVRPGRVDDNHANISSWTESIRKLGAEPRTAWTKINLRIPPAREARLLDLKSGQRAIRIERLRLLGHEPICLMVNFIPLALAPDLIERGLEQESLYAWLFERYGYRPALAEEEVFARAANHQEIQQLGKGSKIVLVIHRRSLLKGGRPLELARIVAPANRYHYQVQLRANQPNP